MKIAICTPTYGDVTADYAQSLVAMVLRTVQTPIEYNGVPTVPEIKTFLASSSVLPQLRNLLVKLADEWGANYLLWIDADQSFPEEALLRLLSHNLAVVGVNYPRRAAPHHPTAVSPDGELCWTREEDARGGSLARVRSLGLGFCLMDMNVLRELRHPTADGEERPLFALQMLGDGTRIRGEDVHLFMRLEQEAGVPIYLDHALSWSIGHVAKQVLTNADAGGC